MDLELLRQTMSRVGLLSGEERQDAKFVQNLARELEHMKARTFDIKFPDMKARLLIPVSNEADEGAETITYDQWTEFGIAKIIANYADDLEMIDVLKEQFTNPVQGIGKAFSISIQDLRRAAMSGNSIPIRKARACRRAIERGIEQIAAFGNIGSDPSGGLRGFYNNTNVTVLGAAGLWSAATPAAIIGDLNDLVEEVVVGTLETVLPDTLVLDQSSLAIIRQRPIAVDNQTTILRSFLANNPYIKNIDSWFLGALADAGGSGPRIAAYFRDPEILELEIPAEYEELPPEPRNLAFITNAHARVGGVVMYYPLGVAYMDGV